ncbi:MAG: hypothetical protein KME29_29390 [Calothrix sp. FI2-JRJ7]|nr:hypothetical protein [Calothrix sp. FI2-JRJ7]
MSYYQQGLKVAKATGDTGLEARILSNVGLTYGDSGDSKRALEYCNKALAVVRRNGNHETISQPRRLGSIHPNRRIYIKTAAKRFPSTLGYGTVMLRNVNAVFRQDSIL